MQFVSAPAAQIIAFVNNHRWANADKISELCDEYVSASRRLIGGEYKAMQVLAKNADSVYSLLAAGFADKNNDSTDFKKTMIYADNLREYVSLVTSSNGLIIRDSSMAINLSNILKLSAAPAKAVVWSHNMHQWKVAPYMGSFLKNEFGNNYLSIGFAFDKGSYNGADEGVVAVHEALPSYPGSFEYICKDLANSSFVMDLRPNKDSSNLPQIFFSPMDQRNIGLTARKYSYAPMIVPDYYDAVIYIPNSTPTKLLDFAK